MESEKKLLGAFENARGTCCQAWIHPDRCVVRTHMENPDYPEVLAVALIPAPEERKRRERLLARLLLLALEMLLSEGHTDLSVKIETAKDVILEFKHTYPEAMNI
jgi:hypothetical protein